MIAKNPVGLSAAILFVTLIAGASIAQAQRMAPLAGARASVQPAHARPVVTHVVSTHASSGPRHVPTARSGVRFNAATSSFVASDGSSVSLQDLLNPVPGYGFDYHHLSVINQDLGIKAVIDPVTEWKLAVAERLLRGSRFAGSGFYLLDGGGAYAVPDDSTPADSTSADSTPPDQQSQQPQVIVVQAQPNSQQTAEQPAPEESELPTDVGQFILVLQNGTQVQAVAFTRMKDRIVYITVDGSRRTMAAADLNSDATMQINEERGTPLQLPL